MIAEDKRITDLLDNKKRSLIEVYLDLQVLFEEKYGPDTVVVMEVGSFYEVYGVDNSETKIGKPKEIAEILNLQLTRKNKSIKKNDAKNPLLCGFPTATFDRYIQRLVQENKYTIVIIKQKGLPPNITRYLDTILSPGVNFDFNMGHDDNYITSLTIDENRGVYTVGYAAIDITTGKSYVCEMHGSSEDKTCALDHVFSLLKSYRTSEVLLSYTSDTIDHSYIEHYLELHDLHKHTRSTRLPIHYQNELFKQTYLVKSFLSPIEMLDLERKPLASESLAALLEFIIEHDHHVVQKLNIPEHLNNARFVYLGNNPLEQLNIISRDPHAETILSLIDHTSTSMGKRLLKERILNPIVDGDELSHRYDLSDALSDIYPRIDAELKTIYDLERIKRRLAIARLHPFEINFLYDSLTALRRIADICDDTKNTTLAHIHAHSAQLDTAIGHIDQTFDLDATTKVAQKDIADTLFQTGFDGELDALVEKRHSLEEKLEHIRCHFVSELREKTGKSEDTFVILRQLDKEGHHLAITKSRYYLIEDTIKDTIVTIDNERYPVRDFRIKIQTSNVKISADVIDTISEEIVVLQTKISALVKELFLRELHNLDTKYNDLLSTLIYDVSCVDVALSNIKASQRLRLARPEIVAAEASIIELKQVRHLLVESREENGIYVPNDVVMGSREHMSKQAQKTVIATQVEQDVTGMLLYGINSSGKSSLMKSIGVCIILAQSGFFVPAEAMRFSLVRELFTRIIAQDNFSKGLSSFAVEMVELKNIFNRATPHSLILGDEISHGTETLSALAIVGATIKRLTEIGSLFIFTTHLHQLHHLHILDDIQSLVSVHLAVRYDEKSDKLIFDRTLQEGSGSSVYGLEFAQSLHIDETFLTLATNIRKELAHNYDDIELLTKKKTSKYNKKLLMTTCAVCKKKVDDVHHINPQQIADEHGNIAHFHKDHKYNLVALCKSCHEAIHYGKLKVRGYKMTSEGLELEVTNNE